MLRSVCEYGGMNNTDAIRNWINTGEQIAAIVTRHGKKPDGEYRYNYRARNREPIMINGSDHGIHEGWGAFADEAIQDLAQITGIPIKAFRIIKPETISFRYAP